MRISMLFAAFLLFACAISAAIAASRDDDKTRNEERRIERVRYGIVENVRVLMPQNQMEVDEEDDDEATDGMSTTEDAPQPLKENTTGDLDNNTFTREGIELIVRFQNSDEVITITQEDNPYEIFEPGDVVRIMTVNGNTRVLQ